jgi:hypothetical protein
MFEPSLHGSIAREASMPLPIRIETRSRILCQNFAKWVNWSKHLTDWMEWTIPRPRLRFEPVSTSTGQDDAVVELAAALALFARSARDSNTCLILPNPELFFVSKCKLADPSFRLSRS